MAATIVSLVATQLVDGTARVHVTASVTESNSKTVGLAYEFRKVGTTAWLPAITTGPLAIAATPGGVALDFNWDLDASSSDTATTGNFEFRIVGTVPAIAATGSFTAVAAHATTGIKDGDTIVIGGRTYEFDNTGTTTANRVAVVLATTTDTAAQVKAALIAAVNGDALATVTASSGAGAVVDFTTKTAGVAANVVITYVFANAITPTKTGMAGGVDIATVTSSTATLTAAVTNAVPALPETITIPSNVLSTKNSLYISRFEGTKKVLGNQPQAFLKGTEAYAALDALLSGQYEKFNYQVYYSKISSDLTVAQMDARNTMASLAAPGSPAELTPTVSLGTSRRAVLISVAEFTRVSAGHAVSATLESKQWLAYNGYRSFTRYFANPNKVYAIYSNSFVPGAQGTKVLTKTVIAYLMLESYYESLRG